MPTILRPTTSSPSKLPRCQRRGASRSPARRVTAGQFVTVADLTAGKLGIDGHGRDPHPGFTFQVEDSGSTDDGGAVLDPTPKTLIFDSLPVANDQSYGVDETAFSISHSVQREWSLSRGRGRCRAASIFTGRRRLLAGVQYHAPERVLLTDIRPSSLPLPGMPIFRQGCTRRLPTIRPTAIWRDSIFWASAP